MINPRHSDLFRIWNNLRGRRSMPRVSDITAGSIAAHLPDILMIERSEEGAGRIRLAGTAVCALADRELSGGDFADFWRAEDRADLERVINAIFSEEKAAVIGAIGHRSGRAGIALAVLLMPVEAEQDRPRRILGALIGGASTEAAGAPIRQLQIASIRFLDRERHPSGIYAAGLSRSDVSLQRGHLVLLKGGDQSRSGASVIRR